MTHLDLLTIADAAALAKVSRRTVERWVSTGKLQPVLLNGERTSGSVRIPSTELERVIGRPVALLAAAVFDHEKRLHMVSSEYAQPLGWRASALRGVHADDLAGVDPTRDARTARLDKGERLAGETMLRARDGSLVRYVFRAVAMNGGEFYVVVGTAMVIALLLIVAFGLIDPHDVAHRHHHLSLRR